MEEDKTSKDVRPSTWRHQLFGSAQPGGRWVGTRICEALTLAVFIPHELFQILVGFTSPTLFGFKSWIPFLPTDFTVPPIKGVRIGAILMLFVLLIISRVIRHININTKPSPYSTGLPYPPGDMRNDGFILRLVFFIRIVFLQVILFAFVDSVVLRDSVIADNGLIDKIRNASVVVSFSALFFTAFSMIYILLRYPRRYAKNS